MRFRVKVIRENFSIEADINWKIGAGFFNWNFLKFLEVYSWRFFINFCPKYNASREYLVLGLSRRGNCCILITPEIYTCSTRYMSKCINISPVRVWVCYNIKHAEFSEFSSHYVSPLLRESCG